MHGRIFISYSDKDRDAAEFFAQALRDRGAIVWLARELAGGDNWVQAIEHALESSDQMLLIVSEHSMQSGWVRKEMNLALIREEAERRSIIVPVRIDDALLPPFLWDKQCSDFRDRATWADAVGRLSLSGEEPPKGDPIDVVIVDWIEPDSVNLRKRLFARQRDGKLPPAIDVRIVAPQYKRLYAHVHAQMEAATDEAIVIDQTDALSVGAYTIRRAETCASELLRGVAPAYGLNAAVQACRPFLKHRMACAVHAVGKYQLADAAMFDGFTRWFEHRLAPEVAQFVFGQSRMLDVKISARSDGPQHSDEFITAYVPVSMFIDGTHLAQLNIWDSARHIPENLWLDYVVPQIAVERAAELATVDVWRREDAYFLTEGLVWEGTRGGRLKDPFGFHTGPLSEASLQFD